MLTLESNNALMALVALLQAFTEEDDEFAVGAAIVAGGLRSSSLSLPWPFFFLTAEATRQIGSSTCSIK